MTPVAIGALIIAIVLAVGDWRAVIRDSRRLEYWCKPGATMALVVVAATLNPTNLDARALIVVALVASLAGDVFLMLPKDHFVAGLGAFFIAQVLYAVAFRRRWRLEIRFVLKTAELHERIGDTVFGVFLRGYQKQGLPTRHNGVEMISVHQMND